MDYKEIKELIRIFDKSELNKLKIKDGDFEISMQTGFESGTVVTSSAPVAQAVQAAPTPVVAQAAPAAEVPSAVSGDTINSPMVGTFYASPSPESAAFVKAGDTVKAGQTLCILEAMKIMNEVEAEYDCKIIECLVSDSDPVEYDMPLFIVEKI